MVNFEELTSGDESGTARLVGDLGAAFGETGFVRLSSPGISEKWIEELYHNAERFFSLPYEVKRNYEIPGGGGQRGYTSFGVEHARGFQAPDLKEFFQFGQPEDPGTGPCGGNILVTEIPDLNPCAIKLFRSFEKTGKYLMRVIARYLNLEEGYFENWVQGGCSILRVIHYPPILREPEHSIRAEQHEDINLITLLAGASSEGLEVLNPEGQWIPVTAEPGELLVNVGDMLQRITNDRFRSATHRVVNPGRDKWHLSRYSIPFFLHPRPDMPLKCLKSCITPAHPVHYPELSAGQYLDERLREIGLRS